MLKKLFSGLVVAISLSLGNQVLASESEVNFVCKTSDGVPITQMIKGGKALPIFFWKEEFFPADKASALCDSVAAKLKNHYQNGDMANGLAVTTSWHKGKDIVCLQTATETCPGDSYLFELASGNILADILPEESEPIIDDGQIAEDSQGGFRRSYSIRFWW